MKKAFLTIGSLISVTLITITIKIFIIKPNVTQPAQTPRQSEITGNNRSATSVNGSGNVVGSGNGNVTGSNNVIGSHNKTAIYNYLSTSPQQQSQNTSREYQVVYGNSNNRQSEPNAPSYQSTHKLKGWLTLEDKTKREFDELQTTSTLGPAFLDIYPRELPGKKMMQVNLKDVASVTFRKSVIAKDGTFIPIFIQFRNGERQKTFVGQVDKLITAKADEKMDIDYYKIEKIEFQ